MEQVLAKMLKTSHSGIGRYEREEMVPSIEVVKKTADFLKTTVGCLLVETDDINMFRDSGMLKRFNDINGIPDDDHNHIIYTIDAMLNNAKLKTLTATR